VGWQCPLPSLESSVNSIIVPSSGDFIGHFSFLNFIIEVFGSHRRCLACTIVSRPRLTLRSMFDSYLLIHTRCLQ